jgi:3',5'-nucleoside bisphosphate phosphatase
MKEREPFASRLLADFHVHTRYSDGELPLRDVVDLFGQSGHDVIAITDHITDQHGLLGRAARYLRKTVTPRNAAEYFAEIASEAARAWSRYRMIVIPGAELTHNAATSDASCHILALGITEYLSADRRPLQILKEIRRRGAVSVACHPHRMREWFANTFYLWNRRHRLAAYVDRWEAACRWEEFPVVTAAKLPAVANGDFHRSEHLYAWKTVLHARRDPACILTTLASPEPLEFLRLEPAHAGERAVVSAFA